jgi:hypothetical protein
MRGVVLFAYGAVCDLMLKKCKLKGVYIKLKDV